MSRIGTLIGIMVLVAAGGAQAEDAWSKFASEEGRFSVEVPSPPVKSQLEQKSFIGTVTSYILTSESGKDRYTVDYSDIPHFALHFAGPDTIYEHAKGALLKKTFGKAVSYDDATVGGHAGKQLVYDTPPKEGHPEMRGDAVLVLVGTRLYVVDAVVREGESNDESKRFLSSLEITK
ncbi:MAG: hypothetical protein ACQGVC_22480 [Myxococcota bacterium]